ncbi:MAG: hypothetical protein K0S30_758 [Clostridia bacterium]|jgi:hypothetical protein|nr:hypothetical protein [Clostridia bacterium]
MGDVFTKLGESIKSTFKEATTQTQKSVDQTVYRTELLSKKNELKKAYQQLGEAQYEVHVHNAEEEIPVSLYTKIEVITKEIAQIEKQVGEIVTTQKDSFDTFKRTVKTTWDENMAKQTRPEKGEDGVEIMKICSHCNVGNNISASYCISCGNKF